MKTEIKKILYKFLQDGITSDDAAQQVLDLFDVVGRSEQLKTFADYAQKRMWENEDKDLIEFTKYRRKQIAEMRPVTGGDIAWFQTYGEMEREKVKISISETDLKAGSPKIGDMIARNPKNHEHQWLVPKAYFEDNLEPL